MAKKAHVIVDELDDPCVLSIKAATPNPEEAMIQTELDHNLKHLRAVLDLTPTPEDIFFICSTIHKSGTGKQSRQTIAQCLQISEEEASMYIEWAKRVPKITGKTSHQVFAEVAALPASQIPSLPRRLLLN